MTVPKEQPSLAKTAPVAQPIDWSAFLGEHGLPAPVVSELNRIFTTTTNIQQAVPIAQAYIRGTPWYAQTYPGIQAGINAGLFANESGYMAYKNDLTQAYKQYLKRPATSVDVLHAITAGKSAGDVGKTLQASAIRGNLAVDPLGHLFTPGELTTLANQEAGIDTQQGQALSAKAALLNDLNPVYQQYTGQGINRDALDYSHAHGITKEQASAQFASAAYLGANVADIRTALGSYGGQGPPTVTDLTALGEQAVGYDNPQGAKLLAAYEKAKKRMDTVFTSTIANPSLSLGSGRPRASTPPGDVAA